MLLWKSGGTRFFFSEDINFTNGSMILFTDIIISTDQFPSINHFIILPKLKLVVSINKGKGYEDVSMFGYNYPAKNMSF